MKLRLLAILFTNILWSSVALGQDSNFSPRPGFGDALYVDPSGNDTVAQKGSLAHKYKTIRAAVTAAVSGDVIEVGPGTYAENVVLKAGITLQGSHPRQCVIFGNLSFAPVGAALTDVAHVQRLQVTGTISCDYSGKTGGTSYGFLDIRECQFPTLTCLARPALGNDGVSVQDFVWDTLPEVFNFTCTNGFFDLEHVQVGALDSEGDAFGDAVVANVSSTTTVNSDGGFNFYNGVISGDVTVAAAKGSALHMYQTSVIGSTITIGAGSTVTGTATRFTDGTATAGAGTYDPDTNLVAGSGITITYAGDKATIVNSSSPGTQGLPSVLGVDARMSQSIIPTTDNTVDLGSSSKRLTTVHTLGVITQDGSPGLLFGGTTNAFTGIRGSGGVIGFVAADNSAYASWVGASGNVYNTAATRTGIILDGEGPTLALSSLAPIRWSSVAGAAGTADIYASRTGVGTLGVSNGVNPAQLQVFNTTDSTSSPTNWEALGITSFSNDFYIITKNGGAGVNRNLFIGTGSGVGNLGFVTNNTLRFEVSESGNLQPFVDNTYDIGGSGLRVHDLYLGGSFKTGTIDATVASGPIVKLNEASVLPGNPLGTTSSGVGVMAGLAVAFTPRSSGRVLVIVSVGISNSVANNGTNVQARYGTGTAPANGAALTGTTIGAINQFTEDANASRTAVVPCTGIVSGLTVGTTYWFDLSQGVVFGGTTSFVNITYNIIEL